MNAAGWFVLATVVAVAVAFFTSWAVAWRRRLPSLQRPGAARTRCWVGAAIVLDGVIVVVGARPGAQTFLTLLVLVLWAPAFSLTITQVRELRHHRAGLRMTDDGVRVS